jgi:hypothetical protein
MADSLYSEVRDFIQTRLDAGLILRAEWVTAEIIASKHEPECDDADFYLICARNHIAEVVKKCIGKYSTKPATEDQLKLPGFEHMQKAYQVERDAVRLLVPTDALTDAELLARAEEYDLMAVGCRAHAREIRDFVERRATQGAA